MGTVMGSKKLKAIAVRGTQGVAVVNKSLAQRVVMETIDALRQDSSAQVYARYGTPSLVRVHQAQGRIATRNYQETQFQQWENVSAEQLEQSF